MTKPLVTPRNTNMAAWRATRSWTIYKATFWHIQPTDKVEICLPLLVFLIQRQFLQNFANSGHLANLKRYDTPLQTHIHTHTHTHTSILYYFVSNKMLKIYFIGHAWSDGRNSNGLPFQYSLRNVFCKIFLSRIWVLFQNVFKDVYVLV